MKPAGDTSLFSHFPDNEQTNKQNKNQPTKTTTKKWAAQKCYMICLGKMVLGFGHGFLTSESILVTSGRTCDVNI